MRLLHNFPWPLVSTLQMTSSSSASSTANPSFKHERRNTVSGARSNIKLSNHLCVAPDIICRTDLKDTICLFVWFIANKMFWLVSPCNEVVLTLVNKWKDISAIYHQCGFLKAWRNWVNDISKRKTSITIELCHKCSCTLRTWTANYVWFNKYKHIMSHFHLEVSFYFTNTFNCC